MSDILDIQSQCCSEFEEESDNITFALKESSKNRKGTGFSVNSSGELRNIKHFDRLHPIGVSHDTDVKPQSSVEGWVLFIMGIHEEASEDDVKDLFQEFGTIKNLILNLDRRTGYIKGYALIEYENYDEAYNAKENLDESQLLGQTIRVNWGFIKVPILKRHSQKQRPSSKPYYCYQTN